eukprot:1742061-Pleurochrysis_carterae.AAC.3
MAAATALDAALVSATSRRISSRPLPLQRDRYGMRAATLSMVLRIDSISCLSTLSMCSGEITKRARSESVSTLGGADTDKG